MSCSRRITYTCIIDTRIILRNKYDCKRLYWKWDVAYHVHCFNLLYHKTPTMNFRLIEPAGCKQMNSKGTWKKTFSSSK